MVDDNTKTLGMVAIAGFIGYKVMSGTASAATAPFRFVGDTASGAMDFVGSVAGGGVDTADGIGDFVGGIGGGAGDIVNSGGDIVNGTFGAVNDGFDFAAGGTADVISAPGNVASDAYGGVTSTVDNVGETVGNALPF